jgi:hypothetical protein
MAAKQKFTSAPAKQGFIESMECLPIRHLPEGTELRYEIKLERKIYSQPS